MSDTGPVTADVLAYFSDAVKEKLKALVAIDGPTGSGKTWTGLQAARILAGPDGVVAFIDTENRTALHYAAAPGDKPQRVNFWDEPYVFKHMTWNPPYNPGKLAEFIDAAQDHFAVIVVDSVTHFWSGEGGTLDVVDDAASRAQGNSFAGWKVGSPMQRGLLDVLIHARCHIIITMRSKMEWVIEQQVVRGQGGKERTINVPRKIGLAPEQRAGIEYEFNVVADMDLEHRVVVTKTRCSLLADAVAQKGRSAELWQKYAAWLDTGVAMPSLPDVEAFVGVMNAIGDPAHRKAVKVAIFNEFGYPDRMTAAQLEAASERVAELTSGAPEGPAQDDGIGAPDQPGSTEPTSDAPTPTDPGEATTAPVPGDPAPAPDGSTAIVDAAVAHAEQQTLGPTPPPPVEGVIAGAVAKQNRRAAKSA